MHVPKGTPGIGRTEVQTQHSKHQGRPAERQKETGTVPINRQHPATAHQSNQDLQGTERQSHRDP